MKLKLKTLSPVHIGSGKSLEPFEYIVKDNIFYRLDEGKAFKIIYEKYPNFTSLFNDWLDEMQGKIYRERDNAKQASLRNAFHIGSFCNYILKDKLLINAILQDGIKYKIQVPYGLQKKAKINEILKSPDNKLYIPGSSLKGFFRTAILWKQITLLSREKKKSILNQILTYIEKAQAESKGGIFRKRQVVADVGTALENMFLNSQVQVGAEKLEFRKRWDIKKDLMGYLHITDAYSETSLHDSLVIYPIDLYQKIRPKQTQTNCFEMVRENICFDFYMSFDLKNVSIFLKDSQATKKLEDIFQITINGKMLEEVEKAVINSLLGFAREFTNELITQEISWFDSPPINASFTQVSRFYQKILGENLKIRLGWGKGFFANTVILAFLSDKTLLPELDKISSVLEIGLPPRSKGRGRLKVDWFGFPRSKRLITSGNDFPEYPTGWCKIESDGLNGLN